MKDLIAAAVQLNSCEEKPANLATATRLVEQAARAGAQLVALPEMFNCLGRFEAVIAAAEPIPGPTSQAMSALASRLGILLCAGSICERSSTPGKAYNTSLLFDETGQLVARYRKIHLFDYHIPGEVKYTESRFILPGNEVVCTFTSRICVGQATCYDLRFPELFRRLSEKGAEVLLTPSAFTLATGRCHWQTLLQARAIENLSFLVAANQCGQHAPELVTYGHSAIVDPWGVILATAGGDREEVIVAELKAARLAEIRERLPALSHRRLT
jgi:predicted amidohydrolase